MSFPPPPARRRASGALENAARLAGTLTALAIFGLSIVVTVAVAWRLIRWGIG